MKKILITGSLGQLGYELTKTANENLELLCLDKHNLDISNRKEVFEILKTFKPDWVINCAAYTAVDKAETDVKVAKMVNEKGPKYFAEACSSLNIKLIHISTDYVYHAGLNSPIVETDKTNPSNIYGKTKLAGDKWVLKLLPQSGYIIRTSWVYSAHGHNFVKTMLKYGAEKPEMKIVFDQIGSPTYAKDLADAIWLIVENKIEIQSGIYHFSNEGVCSWFDFAKKIFQLQGFDTKVYPIRSIEYPTPASRPSYSLLDKSKLKNALGIKIRHWEEALGECLKEINTG
jgi:dTDP-4-dehydrorhamnose reductase